MLVQALLFFLMLERIAESCRGGMDQILNFGRDNSRQETCLYGELPQSGKIYSALYNSSINEDLIIFKITGTTIMKCIPEKWGLLTKITFKQPTFIYAHQTEKNFEHYQSIKFMPVMLGKISRVTPLCGGVLFEESGKAEVDASKETNRDICIFMAYTLGHEFTMDFVGLKIKNTNVGYVEVVELTPIHSNILYWGTDLKNQRVSSNSASYVMIVFRTSSTYDTLSFKYDNHKNNGNMKAVTPSITLADEGFINQELKNIFDVFHGPLGDAHHWLAEKDHHQPILKVYNEPILKVYNEHLPIVHHEVTHEIYHPPIQDDHYETEQVVYHDPGPILQQEHEQTRQPAQNGPIGYASQEHEQTRQPAQNGPIGYASQEDMHIVNNPPVWTEHRQPVQESYQEHEQTRQPAQNGEHEQTRQPAQNGEHEQTRQPAQNGESTRRVIHHHMQGNYNWPFNWNPLMNFRWNPFHMW